MNNRDNQKNGEEVNETRFDENGQQQDPDRPGEKIIIVNGEKVTVIEENWEAPPIFHNLCLVSENRWNLEAWTEGGGTPGGVINIGLRLTRPVEKIEIAPKARVKVKLIAVGDESPSFKNEFEVEFKSIHRKSLGVAYSRKFGRKSLTEPRDGWETSIENPFPHPKNPKVSAVVTVAHYHLKVEVHLQDGTEFVSPPLPIEVMDREELLHPTPKKTEID